MRGDFGYMEEGELGKPYNLRLLKRLMPFASPYKMMICLALFFAILITLLDLSLPYLSKVAIDRYIRSSWYLVKLSELSTENAAEFLLNYNEIIEKNEDNTFGLIRNTDLIKIDTFLLQEYRNRNIISKEKFYKVKLDRNTESDLFHKSETYLTLPNGFSIIPLEKLNNVSTETTRSVRDKDLKGLVELSFIILFIIILSFGINYYELYLLEFIGQHIMRDIRLKLFQKIQSRAISFFDHHPVGVLVTRATNDIENLNEMFKSVIITVFKDIFILIGIFTLLLYLNWRLALVSFIILPPIFLITRFFSSMAREVFRELRAKVAKINAFLQERYSGMHIIQLFAMEQFQMNGFSKLNHENFLIGMRQIRIFATFMPIMELCSSLAIALLIWHGGGKVIEDQLSLGSLVAFISYIQMFFKPIRDISEKYNIMQLAMASTERILEFMDNGEKIPESESPEIPAGNEGHLEFNEVSFSYDKKQPVLTDISFDVKTGETIAIVGATGAGKSTIIHLIERFYDVDKGCIRMDGTDIRNISKDALRLRIGLVMQDVFLFSGTLRDNITLGRSGIGDSEVREAVERTNAISFIRKLPDGLDHKIGEGGSTLSGGERQLLSFARALAAKPKLLILDEATSSVDPETEQMIQQAISKMTQKQTTLVVAHRLSTIRKANRILVMHQGRIQEQGTHDELMEMKRIYFKLNKFKGNTT